jgi:hypothetical protein
LTYTFAWFLMQMEEAEGTEGINDEEQPGGAGNDEGPSAPHDGNKNVPDAVMGHQDTTEGNWDHEVLRGACLECIRQLSLCKFKQCA